MLLRQKFRLLHAHVVAFAAWVEMLAGDPPCCCKSQRLLARPQYVVVLVLLSTNSSVCCRTDQAPDALDFFIFYGSVGELETTAGREARRAWPGADLARRRV
jgi:hypothetical protein